EQLKNYFDVPDKNILVNYPGCSKIFTPKSLESCDNILKSKYKAEGDYILYSGSIHIRKNLENLIRAFAQVKIQHKDLKLLIAGSVQGKRRAYYEKLKNMTEELKLQDSVIFTGPIDYNDMPYLYSKAKCTLNLSKYEGFPLSSIEAMACNTPVIWNQVSFFREVFQGAGLSVDANDNDRIKDAVLNILYSHSLRNSIIKEQEEMVSKYTWEKHIINTVRLYETFN
ncbi:MAG: glycosyltransferase family 4 protein, partial [Bacillota bacterium]|nr:glycosyltransferase family 4 protein [Bacillota bacterium]